MWFKMCDFVENLEEKKSRNDGGNKEVLGIVDTDRVQKFI